LFVVTRSDKVRVAVDIPELEAPLVTAGEMADTALIRVQALNIPQFSGTVSRTSWSLDGTNRSLRVEIDLPNDEGLLRPGMFANVTILLDTASDALVIPATAVIREDQKAYCAKIVGGKIERVPVELGLRSGAEIVVRRGLSESDTIVLVRPELLKPGDAVEAITPAK
jgi:membrane fusion protein (multidrug efflux system)